MTEEIEINQVSPFGVRFGCSRDPNDLELEWFRLNEFRAIDCMQREGAD